MPNKNNPETDDAKLSRIIRFPLKINDKEVRTFNALKNNFEIKQIFKYFLDGKLAEWLNDRADIDERCRKAHKVIGNLAQEKAKDNLEALRYNLRKRDNNVDENKRDSLENDLRECCSNVLKECFNQFKIEGIEFKNTDTQTITYGMARILCRIFENAKAEAELLSDDNEAQIEIDELENYNKREDIIRQKTDNKKVGNHPMETAWDQKSLDDALENIKETNTQTEPKEIYLLHDDDIIYTIDCKYRNIKYEGIDGKPLVIFVDGETVLHEHELKKYNISKKNIEISRINYVKKLDPAIDNKNPRNEHLENPINQPFTEPDNEHITETTIEHSVKGSNEQLKNELILYVDSGIPGIYLNTDEPERAFEAVQWVAKEDDRDIIVWNERGFLDLKQNIRKRDWDFIHTLDILTEGKDISNAEDGNATPLLKQKLFVIQDLNTLSPEIYPHAMSRLRFLIHQIYIGAISNCNIIIVAPEWNIPTELDNYVTMLKLRALTQDEIKSLIVKFCDQQKTTKLEEDFVEELSMELKGLPEFNIINILAMALAGDAEITQDDITLMREQKKQLIQKTNILDIVETDASLDDVGGLDNLREWLKNKAQIFDNEKINRAITFGVSVPKGVLIAGMPGCGKSLAAKATAKEFDIPLIRFDMGRLMGKYVGESEANMRMALEQAEAMAPCVLWIDELEKSFAGIGDSGAAEVTNRLFGMFLTWMQDKKSRTFVVATANNIQQLPPELLRKGRFDEIFYVSLPNEKERATIFELKIKQRRAKDWDAISKRMDEIVKESQKYSGADIESVVSDAVEMAFLDKEKPERPVTADDILLAMRKTTPLAKIDDTLNSLRNWFRKKNFKPASESPDDKERSLYERLQAGYMKFWSQKSGGSRMQSEPE